MSWLDSVLARDLLPDPVIRFGIRRLLAARLRDEDLDDAAAVESRMQDFVAMLENSPLALHTGDANAQHYELPTEFFQRVLGKRLKYSSAYFEGQAGPHGSDDLDQAEDAMLRLTAQRAELDDGQEILELGCGWGSLTLYMAERFPGSRILAVSNSATQKAFIDGRARDLGLDNLEVLTADMRHLSLDRRFDRVVSVEMFEHMRNYRLLLQRVASWLRPDGKLFVHIFCHRALAYVFEAEGPTDWMGRYFFTGGLMPSVDLLEHFDDTLQVEAQWQVNGQHYQRTSEAWLRNMDRHKKEIFPILEQVYGTEQRRRWWVYWRVFFLACAELFGFRDGQEWLVGHYRLIHRQPDGMRPQQSGIS